MREVLDHGLGEDCATQTAVANGFAAVLYYKFSTTSTNLSAVVQISFASISVSSTAVSNIVHPKRPWLDGALRESGMYTGVSHTAGNGTSSPINTTAGMPPTAHVHLLPY